MPNSEPMGLMQTYVGHFNRIMPVMIISIGEDVDDGLVFPIGEDT